MKNIKLLPPFITLLAGAITSIIAYCFGYSLKNALLLLLLVLVVFYVLGVLAMKIITSAPGKRPDEISEEGKVVEKEVASGEEPKAD